MNLVTKKTPISKLPKKMGWGQFDSPVCNFFLWQRPQQNLHVLEIWVKTTYEQGGRGLEEHIAQKNGPLTWPCAFPHQIAEEHRQSAWGDVDVSLQPKTTAKIRDKKGDGDFSYRKGEVCGIADLNSDSALPDSEPRDAAAADHQKSPKIIDDL